MKTLTIKRSKWLTGDTKDSEGFVIDSYLRSTHSEAKGKMCCLGFLALECGAASKQLNDVLGPSDLPKLRWPKAFRPLDDGRDSHTANLAMKINDDAEMSQEDRELKLQGLFARDANIRLLFVD